MNEEKKAEFEEEEIVVETVEESPTTDLPQKPQKSMAMTKRKNELIFLACIFALPIVHKLIFWVGGNFQSILLTFQRYDTENSKYVFNGFNNLKEVLYDVVHSKVLRQSLLNTFLLYCEGTFISIPISLFCSYFVVKKVPGHGMLKVIFFLPSMVSSVVMVLMFKYFCEYALPEIAESMFGVENFPLILNQYPYAYPMMLVYDLWVGFAGGIVLYVGSMSKVPDGVTEAAQIDGVSVLGEFWHITLPTVYPMLSVFLITGLVGIFTGGGPIFTFHQYSAPNYTYTMGYFLFTKVMGDTATQADYPYAAAVGFLITLVATPLTFGLKYLLEHTGPSEE